MHAWLSLRELPPGIRRGFTFERRSMMTETTHSLESHLATLTATEQAVIERFLHGQRVARDLSAAPRTFGERVADRVASFGGSWPFIFIALAAIVAWLAFNGLASKPFDPFPYILLNLV